MSPPAEHQITGRGGDKGRKNVEVGNGRNSRGVKGGSRQRGAGAVDGATPLRSGTSSKSPASKDCQLSSGEKEERRGKEGRKKAADRQQALAGTGGRDGSGATMKPPRDVEQTKCSER